MPLEFYCCHLENGKGEQPKQPTERERGDIVCPSFAIFCRVHLDNAKQRATEVNNLTFVELHTAYSARCCCCCCCFHRLRRTGVTPTLLRSLRLTALLYTGRVGRRDSESAGRTIARGLDRTSDGETPGRLAEGAGAACASQNGGVCQG